MFEIFKVVPQLLHMYRERDGATEFFAEPFNACSNIAFVLATYWGIRYLLANKVSDQISWILTILPTLIAIGSFAFHTVPNSLTMLADMIPIAVFQCFMIWEFSRRLLQASRMMSSAIMLAMIALCAILFPNHSLLNGSLFYMPNVLLMLVFSALWSIRVEREPYLLLMGTCFFIFALSARSIDWLVPWSVGTHFLWHMSNGAMVYVLLRACVMLRSA
jgi:hypothetical protein